MTDSPQELAYPELIPTKSKQIVISLNAIPASKAELESKMSEIEARLDKLNQKFTLGGFPLIDQILKISHDKTEIKGLSQGLGRAADLIFLLDALEDKKRVLCSLETDPDWFALAMSDVDAKLEELDKGLEALDSD